LKCGKTLKNPSLFINPRTKTEGKLVAETISRYPLNETHDGISQIDGITISIGDYSEIVPYLAPNLKSSFDPNHYSADKRIRIVDPSLYILFTGLDSDKEACCGVMGQWVQQLSTIVNRITKIKSQKEKTDQCIQQIYPLFDVKLTQNLLEYQIRANASILINPSVPLSSPRRVNAQTEKTREMNRQGRVLLDTVLSRFKEQRDLMNLIALSPSVLTSANVDDILDATMQGNPDLLGIRLMNLDEKNVAETKSLLQFLKTLSASGKPVFVFNVREFGYVAFCYGVAAISMPIARSPYMTRKKGSEKPVREGSYYHYYDMVDYPYRKFQDMVRADSYRLPCHCEICDGYNSFLKIERKQWNYFRKVHFLLVKNMEMLELRKTDVPFEVALKDKFGRSERTGYVSLLP